MVNMFSIYKDAPDFQTDYNSNYSIINNLLKKNSFEKKEIKVGNIIGVAIGVFVASITLTIISYIIVKRRKQKKADYLLKQESIMKEKLTKAKLLSLLKKAENVDGEFEIINNKLIVELRGGIVEEEEKDDILTKILNSIDEIKNDVGSLKNDVGSLKNDVKSIKNDIKSVKNVVILVNNKLDDVIETNDLKLSREHKKWSFKNDDNPNDNKPVK